MLASGGLAEDVKERGFTPLLLERDAARRHRAHMYGVYDDLGYIQPEYVRLHGSQ